MKARSTRTAKKALGLDWQNNNSARASRFLIIFTVTAQTTTKWKYLIQLISRFVQDVNTRPRLSFSFPDFDSLLILNSGKICQN